MGSTDHCDRRCSCWILDDDCTAGSIIEHIISSMGFRCNLVSSPLAAAEALSADTCQVLIVNATMLLRNSQLQKELFFSAENSSCGHFQSLPKIIGVLPSDFSGMKDRCLAMGFADVLVEPIFQDALYECICYVSNQDLSLSYDLRHTKASDGGQNIMSSPLLDSNVEASLGQNTLSRKRTCPTVLYDNAKVQRVSILPQSSSSGWSASSESFYTGPTALDRINLSLLAMQA